MRNVIQFSLGVLLVLATAGLTGCADDDNSDAGPGPSSGTTLSALEVDEEVKLLLVPSSPQSVAGTSLVYEGDSITFATAPGALNLGEGYQVTYRGERYTLFTTELPVLAISTTGAVDDTRKVGGFVKFYDDSAPPYEYALGIEYRGGSSATHPKRSYSFELRESPESDVEVDAALLAMREDDDWILDGMYNEPNRLRDFTAHQLWLDLWLDNDLPAGARAGIQRQYCELFVNGSYRGVYYLGERIDRKQLQLTKHDGTLRGELYKGEEWEAAFRTVSAFDNNAGSWNGFESVYPDEDGLRDWSSLHDHVGWIINSTAQDFESQLAQRVDLDNAIDYFLFMNVLDAEDNWSKNLYTARVDQSEPYFFVAWDLDGTAGVDWEGERRPVTTDIHTNGLYDRLLSTASFRTALRQRWQALKDGQLSVDALVARYADNAERLERNGVYTRESLAGDVAQDYRADELDYLRQSLAARHNLLEDFISGF